MLKRYFCEMCKGDERAADEVRPNTAGEGFICRLCGWPVTERDFPSVTPTPWEARYRRHAGMSPASSEIGVNLDGPYGQRQVVAVLGGNYADALRIVRCVNGIDGLIAAARAYMESPYNSQRADLLAAIAAIEGPDTGADQAAKQDALRVQAGWPSLKKPEGWQP